MFRQGIFLTCLFLSTSYFLFGQTFQLLPGHGVPGIGRGEVICEDVDNDDLVDIIICGVDNGGNPHASIYINNGDETFANFSGLPELSDGSLAVGDINQDGLSDIFINGINSSNEFNSQLLINQGSGVFTNSSYSFQALAYGESTFSDIDNDGDLDLICTGETSSGEITLLIYKNLGSDNFELLNHNMTGVKNGSLVISDFNNDHFQDIILLGLNSLFQRTTHLYLNNELNEFTLANWGLPSAYAGEIAAADYNEDGYLDVCISANGDENVVFSKLYYNNGGASFVEDATLAAVAQGDVSWGDYDHDGDSDLMISGINGVTYSTTLYENTDGTFADSGIGFPGLINGNINWLDYNNDNKLDVIVSGYTSLEPITNLYENDFATTNTNPITVTGLVAESTENSVTLSWDIGSDTESDPAILNYNLYLGTTSGEFDILAPHSDLSSGKRRKIEKGYINGTSTSLFNLPEGKYYWSVQAIDAGYQSSAFATEQSFTICSPIDLGDDVSVCDQTILHLEMGTEDDIVNWYSASQGLLVSDNNELDFLVFEDDEITAEVENALGCIVSDNILVTRLALPALELGDDQMICLNEMLEIEVGTEDDVIEWSSLRDGIFSTSNSIEYEVTQTDEISVTITDLNECVNTDDLNIEALALPVVDLGEDLMGCEGSEIILTAVSDETNWYTVSGLLLANSNTYTYIAGEEITLWAEVNDLVSSCHNYDTISLAKYNLPLASAGKDTVTCPGSEVTIGGNYDATSDLIFSWSPTVGLNNPASANPLASPEIATTYTVAVTDQNDCVSTDDMVVEMDNVSTVDIGADRSICIGGETQLGGEPTAAGSLLEYSYAWTPISTLDDPTSSNPISSTEETLTYQLITSTKDCRIDTSFLTVNVDPLPVVVVDPEIVVLGPNEQVQLSASGGVEYSWQPASNLSNAEISNPFAFPEETTLYTVTVIDENGCESIGQVEVKIENQFFVPDLFTPNGDGSNDSFLLFGEGIKELSLRVFNRNGQLVFSTNNLEDAFVTGWDGTKSGIEQENGNYVWTVSGRFYNDAEVLFKGKNSGIIKLVR